MMKSWMIPSRLARNAGMMMRSRACLNQIQRSTFSTGGLSRSNIFMEKTDSLINTKNAWTEGEVSIATQLLQSLHDERIDALVESRVQILNRWIDESNNNHINCSRLLDMSHIVLNAIKESNEVVSARTALDLFHKMERLPDEKQRPDAKSFTMVLSILSKDTTCDIDLAEQLFHRALETEGGREDPMVWGSYLHILANRSASDEAEKILKEVIRLDIADAINFSIVMNALANNGRSERAQALLMRLVEKDVPVTESMFNACLNGFAKQGNGAKAENLLQIMIKLKMKPSDTTFTTVIDAWAKSEDPKAGERAEQLLATMEAIRCKPTVETYSAIISAWAKTKTPAGVKRAQQILVFMEKKCQDGNSHVCPSVATYSSVIHALASSRDRGAATEAENLLRRMTNSGRPGLSANTVAYSAVIDVVAKSSSRDAPKRALSLLREMQSLAEAGDQNVAPNTVSFNTVIAACGRTGDVETARSLLDEMKEEAARGNDAVAPDTISYSSVLNGYAKRKDPSSPQLAMELLNEMIREYESGNAKVKPNTVVYTSVISSFVYSPSEKSPEQAEALLNQMQDAYKKGDNDVKPNARVLGAVLHVWSMSGATRAPERATDLIRWAETEFKDGNLEMKVNRICYNYLLATWARSGRSEALDEVKRVIKAMTLEKYEDMQPDVHSYARLMTAIHRSRVNGAPKKQLVILEHLLASYKEGKSSLKPNSQVVHQVLTSCLSVGGGEAAQSVEALQVLQKVGRILVATKEWLPNEVTYKFFFDACYKLGLEDSQLIDHVYQASSTRNHCTKEVEQSYRYLTR